MHHPEAWQNYIRWSGLLSRINWNLDMSLELTCENNILIYCVQSIYFGLGKYFKLCLEKYERTNGLNGMLKIFILFIHHNIQKYTQHGKCFMKITICCLAWLHSNSSLPWGKLSFFPSLQGFRMSNGPLYFLILSEYQVLFPQLWGCHMLKGWWWYTTGSIEFCSCLLVLIHIWWLSIDRCFWIIV